MARAPFHRLSLTLPTARLTVALAVLGVLVIAAAALFAGFFVTSLREVELTSIRNRLEVPAQAMAHVLQAISKNADLTLRDVRVAAAHERGKQPSLGALRQAMLDHLHNRSMATKIELYDAEGRLVVSSLSASPPPVSVADYDFFKRQIAAAGDRMVVSELIADPLDGTTTFTASRPLRNAAGAVEGVVAVYFDTASIQGIFDSLGLPSGTSVVLFTREGRHLLRTGPILVLGDKLLAVDFSQRQSFQMFRDSGPLGDFAEFTTLASGTSRFVAGVGLPDSDFVVTAGWDSAVALAHWRNEATIIIGFTLAGIAIIAALFLYIHAALRRNETLLAEISRSEEKFRALMAALPDSVLIIDEALKINFANAAAEKLYGYESGAMNGLDLRDLIAVEERREDSDGIRKAFEHWDASFRLHGMERTAVRRGGATFPVEINATAYETPTGHKLVSVIRDVSKRQANDRALRRSRESLARAQRVAGVGSFDADLTTGERDWSEEFLRIWGITAPPEKDQVEFLTNLVHPDDRQAFIDGRRAVLAGKVGVARDFRVVRPDGAERILHNEYSADFDTDGTPIRLFGTIQDITERQKVEFDLRNSRENLARAQRIACVGSFVRNLATGEVEFSEELYRIHGVVKGSPQATLEFLHTLVHPDDRDRVVEFRRLAATGQPTPAIDYRITRPDGKERVLHRECDLLFDESGKPISLYGTLQDVTERTQIEIELRRSRENLARAQRLAGIGSFERDLVSGGGEWSDEFRRIWGLERIPEGRLHDTLLQLVHPEDRTKFNEARDAAMSNRPVPAIDFRIRRPDGEERIVHPEYRVVFDESGTPVRMFGTVQDITERKQIELELRRSRENLARAQQIAGIGSFERDLITGKLEWSDEFLRIWGITERPTHGTAEILLSLVHPEDRKRFVDGRDAALGKRENSSLDFRVIRPDGTERILHRDYGVVFNADGKAIRMLGTVQDITDRKQIELEMQRSRETLARAQRIAAMGSFEQDLVTGKAEWSDEMLRILGVEPGSLVPGPEALESFMHPEDRAMFWAARELERKGKAGPAIEFRVRRSDGAERTICRESAVVCDADRRPIRLYGTFADITERKAIETELRRSRENLSRAQRLAGIGSFERDLVANTGEWSEEMYHVLGLERAKGTPPVEAVVAMIHPDDRQKFLTYRAAEMQGRAGKPLEYRVTRPDGSERVVRRETAVLFDDEKRPIRLFGTIQDITERRFAERRERELERQLLHSQKLEALGTLAGGIAHDLNNTLVPIMALSKLTARRFEAGSLVRANLETIYEASERARDLVKRVVAFSRKDDAEKRETDMAEIVDEALKLLRATIPSSITLESTIGKVPPTLADGSQIHQIVTNLVSNASQAIGGEIGTVTVGLDRVAGANGQDEIRLSVSDTGMGMDEATQQRIFEPFFTTKAVGQGTGLGLSIVHGIVAGHGGHIEVKSVLGKGTRFDLYFPVATAEAAVTSSRPAA